MTNGKHRRDRKSIRDFEEFTLFQEALREGFVIESRHGVTTNHALLDCSPALAKALAGETEFRRPEETLNQFRQFLHEVRTLKGLPENPPELGIALRMLRARIGYAAGRRRIGEDLSLVLHECIDRMLIGEAPETQLPGFCDLFESLYAYYYYHVNRRQEE